jgi:hypothetical protein
MNLIKVDIGQGVAIDHPGTQNDVFLCNSRKGQYHDKKKKYFFEVHVLLKPNFMPRVTKLTENYEGIPLLRNHC